MQKINLLLMLDENEKDILATQGKIKRARIPVGQILVAHSLDRGRQLLAAESIDVVFLGLHLQDSHGLDTLKALRPLFSGVLIVITHIDSEEIGIEAIRLGADDYLVKDRLTAEGLRTSLAFALARNTMQKATYRINQNLNRLLEMTHQMK